MIPKKLKDEIERWQLEHKFGSLQINFQDGRIMNVNRVETIKVDVLIGEATITATLSRPDP